MRPALLVITVAFALVGAAPPANRAALKAIVRQYQVLAHGFESQDTTAIMAVRMPEFGVTFPEGRKEGFDRMAAELRAFFVLNHPPIKAKYTIRAALFPTPDITIVTVFQQARRYQDLAGKRRRVDHDVTQRETWVRRGDTWKLAAVDSIRDRHRWIDGKQIDPSKPFDPAAPEFKPPK